MKISSISMLNCHKPNFEGKSSASSTPATKADILRLRREMTKQNADVFRYMTSRDLFLTNILKAQLELGQGRYDINTLDKATDSIQALKDLITNTDSNLAVRSHK